MHHTGRNNLDLLMFAAGQVHFDDQRVAWDKRRLGNKVIARSRATMGGVAAMPNPKERKIEQARLELH